MLLKAGILIWTCAQVKSRSYFSPILNQLNHNGLRLRSRLMLIRRVIAYLLGWGRLSYNIRSSNAVFELHGKVSHSNDLCSWCNPDSRMPGSSNTWRKPPICSRLVASRCQSCSCICEPSQGIKPSNTPYGRLYLLLLQFIWWPFWAGYLASFPLRDIGHIIRLTRSTLNIAMLLR